MNCLYSSAKKAIYPELMTVARGMRIQPTEAEDILWNRVSNKRLDVRFRRQHVINRFIVDFCCLSLKLIIEVDGPIHDSQKIRDAERDMILASLGYKVMRFANNQVINYTDHVVNAIRLEIENLNKNIHPKQKL